MGGALSGCVSTRLLQEQEYLLTRQQIKGTQKVSKQTLAKYYQQPTNTRWLGVPLGLWLYQTGQRSFDQAAIQQRIQQIEATYAAKIAAATGNIKKVQRLQKRRDKKLQAQKKILEQGNLLMRWGEPPTLYSPQKVALTEQNLVAYLRTQGYFDAHVRSEVRLHDRQATVVYYVDENQPYLIEELRLNVSDPALAKLLQAHQAQSLLRKGAGYSQSLLRQERERIYELVSNHGYFSFDRQYIRFDVDTTAVAHKVIIETAIGLPVDRQEHPVTHIEQVKWTVDESQPEATPPAAPVEHQGIIFRQVDPYLAPKLLVSKLPFQLPRLYQRKDWLETQRRLARLGIFKYVNITYEASADGGLVPHIYTAPAERFQLSNELGLQVSNWLPRPFFKLSLASKNLFRTLETMTLSTNVGVEGVTATTAQQGFSSSQGLGIDLSVAWPQFFLPLRSATYTYLEAFDPATKLSIGYDFVQRPEYTQDTFKGAMSYTWRDRGCGSYEAVPLRIDLTDTKDMSPAFGAKLKKLEAQGSNLPHTFEPSWISLLSLRTTFLHQPAAKTDRSYSLLELFLESGGALPSLLNLSSVMPQLTYHQYAKLNLLYSQHVPIYANTVFAYRLHSGIAYAYGQYKVLPYDRYYFLGGSNDMRAWAPRSLGPGTYTPPKKAAVKRDPEQRGEFLLQGSVELRQKLIGFLAGALFIDAGNIWNLRDATRTCPGGQFSFDSFYKEVAVGAGLGLRLDFQLIVLRLDVGFKLYDPAQPPGARFISPTRGDLRRPVFNFGIGYPF